MNDSPFIRVLNGEKPKPYSIKTRWRTKVIHKTPMKVAAGVILAGALATTGIVLNAHNAAKISQVAGHTCNVAYENNQPLPDHHCTPGVVDAGVTVADICPVAHTASKRPPVSYTNNLKQQGMKSYGYADTNLRDFEEDHLISLELGGAPADPNNLWPEPGASPNTKDKVENTTHDWVCQGRMTLPQAQAAISTDWVQLGRQEGVL